MAVLTRLALALVLLGSVGEGSLSAQRAAAQLAEPEAKANFLYYLALFADWPPTDSPDKPLALCVFGASPVTQALRAYDARVVAGRKLTLRDLRDGDDMRGCHVLFLPHADARRLRTALAAVERSAVLTVGEDEGFLQAGGMLRLTVEKARLRFDVELGPADRVGISFSSRLLVQAARVTRGGNVVRH